jgi:hypothetical protein
VNQNIGVAKKSNGQWSGLIGELFDRLTGKSAAVTYTFENLIIDIPKAVGPDETWAAPNGQLMGESPLQQRRVRRPTLKTIEDLITLQKTHKFELVPLAPFLIASHLKDYLLTIPYRDCLLALSLDSKRVAKC